MKTQLPMAFLLLVSSACAGNSSTLSSEKPVEPAGVEAEAPEADQAGELDGEQYGHGDEGSEAHSKHGGHAHGEGGGPLVHRFKDPESLALKWDSPERMAWQKPAEVVDAMAIEMGMTVADIGAGTGYFLPYLQSAVGGEGTVLAVDIEGEMLSFIEKRAQQEGWTSVQTVLATPDSTNLQDSSLDRVLVVNTWHHIPERLAYTQDLRAKLKEGGQVYIVDFTLETEKGPGKHHRLSAEQVLIELQEAGMKAQILEEDLPDQYIVVGQ